jgi:hypothetical protein
MNKVFSILVLGIMLLSAVSAVEPTVLIAGKVYDATNPDHWVSVSGADVLVQCGEVTQKATSMSDGAYSVKFTEGCNVESSLTVTASKGSLVGSNSGVIHNTYETIGFDVGVVNVPMVPEFGVVIGGLTLLSAIGIFFMVRKK